ncbi:MAG TPA: SRPBCC family protein [Thermoanaerobaculia bacterium]|jgi:uncharacterized membrane protein|nr:SRPBCC family protein [Thermoanaerobaculia bacterium]
MFRVGQAAMIASGAALVALAARQRSWPILGAALAGAPLIYRGATGRWPLPQSLVRRASEAVAPAPVETAVTIGRSRAELYAFWRRLKNLPRFMRHLDEVIDLGGGRSHWTGKSPLGFRVEWDAEIVEEREEQLLSWRSLPGSLVHSAGTVLFEDAAAGRGTVVRVSMELVPSGNALGQAVGRVLAPLTEQQVREDLRRFKQLMEAGEIPTTDGQPAGERSLINLHNPL